MVNLLRQREFITIALRATLGLWFLALPQSVLTCLHAFDNDNPPSEAPLTQPSSDINPILAKLRVESDLRIGHPLSLGDMLLVLDSPRLEQCWNVPTTIDSKALERAGVDLSMIRVDHFDAVGVSRRSALRLLLAEASLGYAVLTERIVITTKHSADSYGTANSVKPSVNGLLHDDAEVRRNTAFFAGYWHLDPKIWIAPLIDSLNDTDRDVQFDSAYAIAAFGTEAGDAVDALSLLLKSEDLAMREVAKYALSRVGRAAVSRLIAAIENPDITIARFATGSLGDMGITANGALVDLIAIGTRHVASQPVVHETEYCERCDLIARAIARIAVGGDLGWLNDFLNSPHAGERALAATIVGELGISGVIHEPKLQVLLFDPALTVRRKAAWALANIELPAGTQTDLLEAASRDKDLHVAAWAAVALRKLQATENNE